MSTRFLRTLTLAVLAACSTVAFADTDTPSRVGRISMTQGQVGISGEQGEETNAALVNWPVTSRNQVTTGRDGRTEIRIGSTAVRLDADSALDISELDDNSLRLHLHYGSATIRVRNPDLLRGFDLTTPQGSVRLAEVGQIRVDAGRRQDTTVVSVFSGMAEIDGGGSRLTVRSGKRAEIGQDDVRTGLAMRDSFDEWSLLRDLRDERSESVRYVTNEMTGYEDLDHNGIWREDNEYGPLWSPRNVPYGWAPYRDGRWTYLQPWGWTWVDNAPWGYAPFHYGRWVMVNQRWCWAPGRNVSRVIWSPALVGWVGGNKWNANFGSGSARRAAPATGWYPLTPRDAYVPTYRMAHDNLRYLNRNAGGAHPDVRGRTPYRNDQQRAGLTVVPHEQFRQRGTVVVPTAPRGTVAPAQLFTGGAAQAVPPAPQMTERERSRDWRRVERSAPTAAAFIGITPPPARGELVRRGDSFSNAGRGQRVEAPVSMPAPLQASATPEPTPARIITLPSQPVVQQPDREERISRYKRGDERDPDLERERRPRGAESFQQQQAQAQAQAQRLQQQQQIQQAQVSQHMQQQQQHQQQQAAQQLRMQQLQQQQAQAQQMQQQQQQQQQAAQQARMQQAAQQQQMQQAQQMQQMQQSRPAPQPAQQAAVEQRVQREHPGVVREKIQRAKEDANLMR